jgi:hypothetical protein
MENNCPDLLLGNDLTRIYEVKCSKSPKLNVQNDVEWHVQYKWNK